MDLISHKIVNSRLSEEYLGPLSGFGDLMTHG
jgi:hypothetical protein